MKVLVEQKASETIEFLKKLNKTDGKRIVISFSNINKYGVNPQYLYSTPFGVYGYLLQDFFENYNGDLNLLPYGKDRKYILVLRIKPEAKMLVLEEKKDPNVSEYIKNIFHSYPVIGRKYNFNEIVEKINNNPVNFYNFVAKLVSEFFSNSALAFRKIFIDMGIDIIVDKGTGTIYMSEPFQVAILDTKAAEHIGTLINPARHKKRKISKKKILLNKLREYVLNFFLRKPDLEKERKIFNFIFSVFFPENKTIRNEFYELMKKAYSITTKDIGHYNPLYAWYVVLPKIDTESIIEKIFKKLDLSTISVKVRFGKENLVDALEHIKLEDVSDLPELMRILEKNFISFDKTDIKKLVSFLNKNKEYLLKIYNSFKNSYWMTILDILNIIINNDVPFFAQSNPSSKGMKVMGEFMKDIIFNLHKEGRGFSLSLAFFENFKNMFVKEAKELDRHFFSQGEKGKREFLKKDNFRRKNLKYFFAYDVSEELFDNYYHYLKKYS